MGASERRPTISNGSARQAGACEFHAFSRALGFQPWEYNRGRSYHDGSRFLDNIEVARLLLQGGEVMYPDHWLLSTYDEETRRPQLFPFPRRKTVEDAFDIVSQVGWLPEEARASFVKVYEAEHQRRARE